jgi:outer membrane autotransporter protein
VSGFSSTAAGGVVLQAGPNTKLDLRSGLNYLNATADKHTDSMGIAFGEGELDQFSGTLSARLFAAWVYGNTVVRPFLQGGVDYRFHYANQIIVENVKFELNEGRTTLFGRVGMDFDVGDYVQAYLALRGDHNEDFDTVAGQLGLTVKLN